MGSCSQRTATQVCHCLFFFLRPQDLPAVEHSRNTSQKSIGGHFAFEMGLGQVGWRRCLCGFLMSLYDADWERPTQQEGRLVDIELVSPYFPSNWQFWGNVDGNSPPSPAQDGVQQEQGKDSFSIAIQGVVLVFISRMT